MAVDRIRRRAVIHGRVQGVSFRGSTEDEARRAGIDGWVRNLPDGAVEAVFEGEADAVEQVVAYCHRGPPWAEVMRVDVIEEAPEEERGFRVRR